MSKRIDWNSFRERIPSRIQVAPKRSFEIVWVDSFKDPLVHGETRFSPDQVALLKTDTDKEVSHTYFHEFNTRFVHINI